MNKNWIPQPTPTYMSQDKVPDGNIVQPPLIVHLTEQPTQCLEHSIIQRTLCYMHDRALDGPEVILLAMQGSHYPNLVPILQTAPDSSLLSSISHFSTETPTTTVSPFHLLCNLYGTSYQRSAPASRGCRTRWRTQCGCGCRCTRRTVQKFRGCEAGVGSTKNT